ncbi:hypothetical protein DESC_100101 [Desulfosarcina cetonica]|nr:hypothetical protein DESC_100101 [Desulfosarcina cetonica]
MGNQGRAHLVNSFSLKIISYLNVQWKPWFPMSASVMCSINNWNNLWKLKNLLVL